VRGEVEAVGVRRREAPLETFLESLPAIALALLLSLGLGRAASRFGVPRVTVYLLVGLALGPHALLRLFEGAVAESVLLGPATESPLAAVEHLAIGFILFGVGAEFRFATLRRIGPRVVAISGSEVGLTAVLVGAAVWLGTGDWRLGVVAPALAVSSAPSATLVTLREVEAEGPASRLLVQCVGHNNLAALLLFPVLLAVAFGAGHPVDATRLALTAMAIGGAFGLIVAVGLEWIAGRRELVLMGLLVVLATLGVVDALSPGATGLGMLGCFAAGLAISNGSPHAPDLFRYVENTVYPLYVLFFIATGRDLHVESLAAAGMLGVLFVASRAGGKLFGTRLGLRLVGWENELPPWLGAGLLCQAGVAMGLLKALESADPEATAALRDVVIGSVVFFELIGPVLVRGAVVRAGEVKLGNVLPHSEASGPEAFRWVSLELRRNLGLLRATAPGAEGGPTVLHAMQRRPPTLHSDTPFERVLKALSETGIEMVPVLDGEGRLEGVISYEEVKSALYDPALRNLVIARDLITAIDDPLAPEDSLTAALDRMDRHGVHSWPVSEGDRLAGVVRRADLYALLRRRTGRR
jgi:Kef-type K+ transport system membrane component KefB/CBS domain-containing protein